MQHEIKYKLVKCINSSSPLKTRKQTEKYTQGRDCMIQTKIDHN